MAEVRKLAVIGDPIAHSLSPLLHNTMIRELGLPYTYEACLVHLDGLPQWIDKMRDEGWVGCNVTMPHKLHMIPLMDHLTDAAKYYGAVNTVRNDGGVFTGHNTDGEGFGTMLREHGLSFAGSRVTILGSGGAARAIAQKAILDGAARITMMNRTVEHARELCEAHPDIMTAGTLDMPIPADTDLLINSIPVGGGLTGAELEPLRRDCTVIDILYAPPKTPLLLAAEARGMLAINGLGMLIHQAIPALSFFTGVPIDVETMAPLLYKAAEGKGV